MDFRLGRNITSAGFSTNKIASSMEKYNPNEYLILKITFNEYISIPQTWYLPFKQIDVCNDLFRKKQLYSCYTC